MDGDEAILRAIRMSNDPDIEPERNEEDSDVSSVIEEPKERLDPDMERLYQDSALRQHLGIGTAFTGPKGVIADRKFHREQESARAIQKQQHDYQKLDKQALKSGWNQRQMQDTFSTLEEEEDDEFYKQYAQKRIQQLQNEAVSRYSLVKNVNAIEFLDLVDNNPVVFVHLYDKNEQSCRLVNTFLDRLSNDFRDIKFAKMIATDADANFDSIAFPAILIYENGELFKSLIRISDEIPGWADTGRCEYDVFEKYLISQYAISKEITA